MTKLFDAEYLTSLKESLETKLVRSRYAQERDILNDSLRRVYAYLYASRYCQSRQRTFLNGAISSNNYSHLDTPPINYRNWYKYSR